MLDAIKQIEQFTKGVNESEYLKNSMLQAAIERKLEIIGEASLHLTDELIKDYPEMEWAKLKAFRNLIAHEYFAVSHRIVWGTVKKQIPELKKVVLKLLKKMN